MEDISKSWDELDPAKLIVSSMCSGNTRYFDHPNWSGLHGRMGTFRWGTGPVGDWDSREAVRNMAMENRMLWKLCVHVLHGLWVSFSIAGIVYWHSISLAIWQKTWRPPKILLDPVTNVIVHVPFVTACSRVHWVSETFLVRLHEVLLLLWLGQRKHCSASGPTYHGGRGVAASGFSSHCLVGNIWKPWVVRIVRLWLLGSSGCPVFFLKHIRITYIYNYIYIYKLSY